ncbi:hypothetical protein CYLTODRAFT_427786, partial [Cylindrobasidium torrendii FP15055 ss-10]
MKVENETKANAQREWEARYVTALTKALDGSIAAATAAPSHPPSSPSSPTPAAASRSHSPSSPSSPTPAATPTPAAAPADLEPDDDTSAPETLATVLNYLHDMATIKALRCAVASGNITSEFFEANCPQQPSAPSGLQDLVSALQRFALQGTTGGTQDSEQDEQDT